jgi:class 3 adenylate cyclase/CHASE1-domain containing sensor protein
MKLFNNILGLTFRQLLLFGGLLTLECIISILLYTTIKKREDQVHYYIFESQSKEIVASIQKEITIDLEKILSLKALFDVSYPVSKNQFNVFTNHLLLKNGSIQALSWIPRVTYEEKDRFEQTIRDQTITDFIIKEKSGGKFLPVKRRTEYYPVYFIEPLSGNEIAFGFDLASNPFRFHAMKKADSTGEMAVTEPIELVQDQSHGKGVLVFYPFKKEEKLLGFFSGVFRINDLIMKSSEYFVNKKFNLSIQDLSSKSVMGNLITQNVVRKIGNTDTKKNPRSTKLTYKQVIDIADRKWLLEITPNDEYINLRSNADWLVLLLCIGISIGLCYHLYQYCKSENLLLNILPAEIARELKENGKAEARSYDKVSILFTDFTDFTKTTAKLSPRELVTEINACFGAFDAIITKYGLEKIKTIGDAYMAVGGLPIQRVDSVKNVVLACLEMQNFIGIRKKINSGKGKPVFEMRAGIHTGPVVAGIVGVKKFQYDIWGDAVNTASRMESRGKIGHVNISQATYEILKDDPCFHFEYRGKVQAKGKGKIDMWFVLDSTQYKKAAISKSLFSRQSALFST